MNDPSMLHVAAAQVATRLGDLDANLRRHLDMIEAARAAGADVLVFPELSMTGHGAGPDTLRLALGLTDPQIATIARAAGALCTTFGIIEEAPAAQFYNTAVTVRDGKVVHVHRKVNLATYGRLDDGRHFAGGRHVTGFAWDTRWHASVLICADTWNPALVHLAAIQGSTLLLAPVSSGLEAVGSGFDNPGGWDLNLRFHAMTYGLPIVMANRVGQEGDLTFWGGSRILDPFGTVLAVAPDARETLVSARLDFADVRRARYRLPTVRDANLPVLRAEIERLTRDGSLPVH
ncbi:MAG: nitrilase-related carbon-nitrogen hydrolase [Casimicrobiaceae bacterium]